MSEAAPGRAARLGQRLLLVLLPLLFLALLLEGGAALLGHTRGDGGDPFVGFAGRSPVYVPVPDDPAGELLETAPDRRRWLHYTRFTPEKRHGQYRIFTLGGSTTYGRPYDGDAFSFAGWLRTLLPAVDASRPWEVVNAGGVSYASYRAALVMEELIAYEPDLFVVYTGHNEFLERRTYPALLSAPPLVLDAVAWLRATRSWSLLRGALLRSVDTGTTLARDPEAVLDGAIGPDAYTRDDAGTADALRHLRFNLERMVDLARGAGAAIVFVTPAANLSAFAPFKSEAGPDLTESARQRLAELDVARRAALDAGDRDAAIAALDTALNLDPRDAARHYARGRLLLAAGRGAEALGAFERARDEDVCPLRAPGPVIDTVRAVARRREVPLVDFATRVRELSPDGVPGEAQFLDHVHPDAATYGRLAEWIIDALAAEGLVRTQPDWQSSELVALRDRTLAKLDPVAEAAALRNLAKVLGWAGLTAQAERLLERALERNPDDVSGLITLSNVQLGRGETDAAVATLARAARLEPDDPEVADFHADALLRAGRVVESIAAYRALLALDAGNPWSHNNLAWILANVPDPGLRDPAGALHHARQGLALAGAPDPLLLDTLAAAHAAAGQLDDARRQVERGISLAREAGDDTLVHTLEAHARLYAEGRPAPLLD